MKKISMIAVLVVLCSFTFSGGCSTPPRLDSDATKTTDTQEETLAAEDIYLVECIDSFFDTADSILDVQIQQDEKELRREQKDVHPSYYEDRPLYEVEDSIIETSVDVAAVPEGVKEMQQEATVDVVVEEESQAEATEEIEVLPCFSSCVGKQCGDDGCGGSCGECPCEDCNPFWMLCGPDFTCILAT